MSGKLILVVGPSGAGKDSVIRYVMEKFKEDLRFVFPRRIITRQADIATEDHDAIDVPAFLVLKSQGGFALNWLAHDLHYGVPAEINNDLAEGKHVIVNVSRTILPDMPKLYPNFMVVVLQPHPKFSQRELQRVGGLQMVMSLNAPRVKLIFLQQTCVILSFVMR